MAPKKMHDVLRASSGHARMTRCFDRVDSGRNPRVRCIQSSLSSKCAAASLALRWCGEGRQTRTGKWGQGMLRPALHAA